MIGGVRTGPAAAPGVRHRRVATLFPPERPLILECGERLDRVRVAYEEYGQPDPARSNTVFVCHALTGDAHVARHDAEDEPGWWDVVVGPGRPLDTRRFHVVCANVLGGCAGSTGPRSSGPGGARYGCGFPPVTVADMVAVHRELLAGLGIKRLHAVVGGSFGGMQALEWLLRHPADADRFALIATSARMSADNLAAHAVGRAAIRADPGFLDGDYPDGAGPRHGLGTARMVAHLTYMSAESLQAKCGRRLGEEQPGEYPVRGPFAVERYLEHQADRFVARFDASSYLYLTAAMDRFDPFGGAPRPVGGRPPTAHLFSFRSDRLFGLSHATQLRALLTGAGLPTTHVHETASEFGHDAFLLQVPEFLAGLANALGRTGP